MIIEEYQKFLLAKANEIGCDEMAKQRNDEDRDRMKRIRQSEFHCYHCGARYADGADTHYPVCQNQHCTKHEIADTPIGLNKIEFTKQKATARSKFLQGLNERKLHKERLGQRKDKNAGRSTPAIEARNLKRKFKVAQGWHARECKKQKHWIQNFLLFGDQKTMAPVEKEAQTYIWSFLADDPKVQVMQVMHAHKICEWAIAQKFDDECNVRAGDGNRKEKKIARQHQSNWITHTRLGTRQSSERCSKER